MLSKEKLARLNELAGKAKQTELTPDEITEQQLLRQEYLQTFRQAFKNNLDNVKVVDPEGNDVTPKKLKNKKKLQ
ncbi:DUF896 domain-containing protein [Bacillus sp. HMF5848]|uniref:DUF896 domain-containing protein n=1 Tax=Bacillus sp. HMF5848 TaxID=2495421 RepID=UPI000F78B629|nr:DUF896 domain-containing protein [Bacillus sp. HMF5848]RSK27119.1 DUF896 domain-containing protein [Bacillus sp. HMF5848]